MALFREGESRGVAMGVVAAVCRQNSERKTAMAKRILAALGRPAAGATIAVLGLTFKPDTDDMREAPSLSIIPMLQEAGASVRAYDPKGIEPARRLLPGVELAEDAYRCAANADALVIVTEWAEFRSLDLARLKTVMKQPIVVDLRNIYDPQAMSAAGFDYRSLGRPGRSRVVVPQSVIPIERRLCDLTASAKVSLPTRRIAVARA